MVSYIVLDIVKKSPKTHVSNSGPRAKFGPKCNHSCPVRSYQMYSRAGPRFMLYLYFKFDFSCDCNIKIWLFQILCSRKIKVCFQMKRLSITYQLQLIFFNTYWHWPMTLPNCLILAHHECESDTTVLKDGYSPEQGENYQLLMVTLADLEWCYAYLSYKNT